MNDQIDPEGGARKKKKLEVVLGIVALFIAFATYVVKEELRDSTRYSIDAIENQENRLMLSMDVRPVPVLLVEADQKFAKTNNELREKGGGASSISPAFPQDRIFKIEVRERMLEYGDLLNLYNTLPYAAKELSTELNAVKEKVDRIAAATKDFEKLPEDEVGRKQEALRNSDLPDLDEMLEKLAPKIVHEADDETDRLRRSYEDYAYASYVLWVGALVLGIYAKLLGLST